METSQPLAAEMARQHPAAKHLVYRKSHPVRKYGEQPA